MRLRRDSFGRQTFIPERARGASCGFCGQQDPLPKQARRADRPEHRCYRIRVDGDGGRSGYAGNGRAFCSWECAEAYTGTEFPR